MEKKTCSVCGADKDLTKENYGWRKSRAEKGQNPWVSFCKPCQNAKRRAKYDKKPKKPKRTKQEILVYAKEYREKNKELIAKKKKAYREANKEKVRKQSSDSYQRRKKKISTYRSTEEYKAKRKMRRKAYKETAAAYQRRRRQTDPSYRLRAIVSTAVCNTLKNQGSTKGGPTFSALPYSPQDLVEHLERQFDDKMSWDNYGDYWHVDHIYPQSLLPYSSLEEENFQKCWALENLQPLEVTENMKKSNKVL